jgi:EpsI family protein
METEVMETAAFPKATPPWIGPIYYSEWKPDYRNSRSEINMNYIGTNNKPDVSLHIFYYGRQTQDKELINELNTIADKRLIKSQNFYTYKNQKIIETIIKPTGHESRIIWHWYHVANKNTADPAEAKLFQVQELITGSFTSSLVALSIKCTNTCESSKSIFEEFLDQHYDRISYSISSSK